MAEEQSEIDRCIANYPRLRGFRYIINEAAPADSGWHQFKPLIMRESLEEIMIVYKALQDTNILFDSYMIEIQPVFGDK